MVVPALIVIIHLAGLATISKVLLQERNQQSKILWSVALIVCPYLAVVYFWFLGESHQSGFRCRRSQALLALQGLSESARRVVKEAAPAVPTTSSVFLRLSDSGVTQKNRVELLLDGEEFFPALEECLRRAESYVLFQFYIIKEDEIGKKLLGVLSEVRAKGVDIYIFYDPFESEVPDALAAQLRSSGIELAVHSPTDNRTDPFEGNFRNHRKNVVIDGQVAFVGGMNLADEYNSADPQIGHWRDTQLKISGPAVIQLQKVFIEDFFHVTGTVPQVHWRNWEQGGTTQVTVIATGPASTWDASGLSFVEAVNLAQERVWLATPFFIPDEKGLAALELATLRGVDVRILLPSQTTVPMADLVSDRNLARLLNSGIRFWKKPEGAMHQKALLVDSRGILTGTANYDHRSFHLNLELLLWLEGESIMRRFEGMLQSDFDKADPIGREQFNGRSKLSRLKEEVAYLLSPFL